MELVLELKLPQLIMLAEDHGAHRMYIHKVTYACQVSGVHDLSKRLFVDSHPGPVSLAIPPRVAAVSTGDW